MIRARRGLDWTLLGILVVCWGSSFAMTKISVETITPEWTVAIRLVIGAIIAFAVMRWRGFRLTLDSRHLLWYAWLAMVGSVIPFFLISWGTQYIDSGLAGILMASVPLVVITLAHFLLPDEPMTLAKLAGFIIGFVGVVVLIGPELLSGLSGSGIALVAELAVLLATSAYALHSVTARRSPKMDPLQKNAGVLIAAAAVGLVLALLTDPTAIARASSASLVAVIGLGIFPTSLAGMVLFYLLEHVGAGFVAISNYLIPIFAFLLGVAALDEPFALNALAGLTIILFGVGIANVGTRLNGENRSRSTPPHQR